MSVLFFDIETVPNRAALKYLPDVAAPSNYKDPTKIKGYVKDKQQALIDSAALDPDMCRIRAIGWGYDDPAKDEIQVLPKLTNAAETKLVKAFWSEYVLAYAQVCGYNILGFDLRVLLRRSMELGIQFPPKMLLPDLNPYKVGPIYDLYEIMYGGRGSSEMKGKTLKWVCWRYGIDKEFDDRSGAGVEDMSDKQVAAYLKDDLRRVRELYKLAGGYYWSSGVKSA